MMRATAFVLSGAISLWSQIPKFNDAESIKVNNSEITIKNSSPAIADWDGDGLKDLLIGQFSSGKIHFFKNIGSKTEPLLEESSFLQAEGTNISLSSG